MTRSEAGKLGAAISSKNRMQAARDNYYLNPNICVRCNCVIDIPSSGKVYEAKKRKFCSQSCAAVYNQTGKVKYPNKVFPACTQCSNPITGSGKKFCSISCSTKYRFKNVVSHSGKRRKLLEEKGYSCWKCGWGIPNPITGVPVLILNHIDGNSQNNSDENLEILCSNCDSLTPTYKALNKGNGRHSRRTRYEQGKSY